ncbi:MAG: 50S ribosomal protein L5 [Deltaproteobacteria bacterium]|nr:50S ribosomal protein L5 [Deltaproteobacteria bacterium]
MSEEKKGHEKAAKPAAADKPAAEKAAKADKPAGGGEKAAKAQAPEKAAKAKKGKGGGKDDGTAQVQRQAGLQAKPPKPPRLKGFFEKEVVKLLQKEFNYKNPMQVPRVTKVVVNMGLGEAVANPKIIEFGEQEMMALTGQKAIVTRSKKSIANFKLRENLPIGVMVTLRRAHMWEFLDRLMNIALPRVRDFRGVSAKGFDGQGNYTLGIREHIIFPEVNVDKMDKIKGMNISIVTTARTDAEARALLAHLGMPFRK